MSTDVSSEEPRPPERAGKSALRRGVSALLPLAFTGLLAWFVWERRDQLEPLGETSILLLLAIGGLVTLSHVLNSTEFWLLYRAGGVDTPVSENALLFFAGTLGNYVPGQAGTLYRIHYMRVVRSTAYADSAAVYGANLVATLAGAALVGIAATLVLAIDRGVAVWMLVVYMGVATLAVLAVLVPLPKAGRRVGVVARAWNAFHDGFVTIRRDPTTAFRVVALEVVKYFATALRFQLAFELVGFDEPYWYYLALAPAVGIAQFVSFTPGALGFREAFLAAASLALGSPLSTGLLAATVDRAVMLAATLLLGIVGFAVTYPRLRRTRTTEARSTPP
ncbi:MAG: lysylphosphatidylglycerol synthase transmembrane domain-containing protein [Acidimicrobiia bacterium]|nr:lysylphosphatidylglycerol synthase transmembrane domain-containing protein [Acidimicrobiia bacterium]